LFAFFSSIVHYKIMADDYGYDANYGDTADYGYGDSGGGAEDYGYGDSADAAASDYGYGDDAGGYGYGDDDNGGAGGGGDYGYGDAPPDEAPAAPAPTTAPEAKNRPKRRSSVTRFSMEAEACGNELDYNWNGSSQQQPKEDSIPEQAPVAAPGVNVASDEKSSAGTQVTAASIPEDQEETNDGGSMLDLIKASQRNKGTNAAVASGAAKNGKKGMMSKLRKRLSIAM
jgi:pyruvate/2-oxoglutarate dehydrogenase complex dihydrolipoamide acyltransferase (E2) component